MTNLLFDPRKLGVVLWECCKKQAEANSVSRESFLEAMDGDALASGWGAVVDAIVFFTRSRSQPLAETIQKAIEAQMRVIETGAAALQKAMDGQRTAAAIQGAASKLEIELEETIEKACASFATS